MDSSYASWVARLRVPTGAALAVLYLVLAQPTTPLLIAGGLVAVAGLAIRAWASGYLEKNARLATAGPYAWTRNPLYLGSLFIGAGFVAAGRSWILAVVFALFFLAVYLPVMRVEQAGLRERFREEYANYASRVPLFLPALKRFPSRGDRFRWQRYRKNREYEAALGYVGVIIFLCAKMTLR